MKKIILLALVSLLLFTTGCTLLDKISIGLRATEFFTAWVAQNEVALGDALTEEVTYNGLKTLSSTVVADLVQDEWWTNYVSVGDPESVIVLEGGKATVTYEFTIMEKEKPGTEQNIVMILIYTKSDWASWKIYSVDINPIWITVR